MTDNTPSASAAVPDPPITPEHPVVVLGGGPAGLTAAYQLAKLGQPVVVLESSEYLGGIARTQVREGYRFDLGGHRFFTKVQEVDDLWHEIMKEEFLKRAAQEPDLLERQVPRISAPGRRRGQEARPGRADALHGLLRVGGGQAQGSRGHL